MKSKKFFFFSLTVVSVVTILAITMSGKNGMGSFLSPRAGAAEYALTINESLDNPGHTLTGSVGSFTKTTSNGNPVSFSSANSWLSYSPEGWGSIFENGNHWEAEIHNTTAITGISKIECQLWMNIFNTTESYVPYVNLSTSADSTFSVGVSKGRLSKGLGTPASLGEIFIVETPDLPSYFKLDFGDSSANSFTSSIVNVKVTYSCAAATQKYIHRVNRNGNVFNATGLDATGFNNFQSSYYYLGKYSDTAIISTTITMIDNSARAWSGITITNGEKNIAANPSAEARNFRSTQLGLSLSGLFSYVNNAGSIGSTLRDYTNAYSPAVTVAATGELTIVVRNNTLYAYINNVYKGSYSLAQNYLAGFTAGTQFMFGLYWSSYYNASRTTTLTKEIYGTTDVQAEIASNDVFANLR